MRLIPTLLPLALLAATAYAQDVRYNFASSAVFGKYKTYKWARVKGTDQPQPNGGRSNPKAAFAAELATKGSDRSRRVTASKPIFSSLIR